GTNSSSSTARAGLLSSSTPPASTISRWEPPFSLRWRRTSRSSSRGCARRLLTPATTSGSPTAPGAPASWDLRSRTATWTSPSPCSPGCCGLLADDENHEGVRQNGRPGVRLLRRGGGRRAELGGRQIDLVRLVVERHGPRAAPGGDVLGHDEMIGRILLDHRQRTVAVRAETELRSGIEGVG